MNRGRGVKRPKSAAIGFWVALAAGVAIAGGCSAEGKDIPVDYVQDSGPRKVITNEEGGDASIKPSDAGSSGNDSGGARSDATTEEDAAPLTACSYQTTSPGGTCTAAIDVGMLSGDTTPSINTITHTGKGSQWLMLTVTEDSHGFTEADLSLKITLTSTSGTNYDLYAYVDPTGTPTSRACNTVSGQANNAAGIADEANLIWDDNKISQPNDDTRIVSIKIDHVSGPCDDWTVTIEGNTQ